jgi:hypothetical protein
MFSTHTPKTAQLVVIKGRKMPRPAYRAGMLFLRNISTNCTREAITRMKAMVRRKIRLLGQQVT